MRLQHRRQQFRLRMATTGNGQRIRKRLLMIDELSIATAPKLPLHEVEDAAAGLRIFEVMLDSSGTSGMSVAPFKAACFTVEPGCTTPVDSHSVREIWLVTDGSGELMYDGKMVPLR